MFCVKKTTVSAATADEVTTDTVVEMGHARRRVPMVMPYCRETLNVLCAPFLAKASTIAALPQAVLTRKDFCVVS